MPRRQILNTRQRAALFDLPTDQETLLRHYTLADDDIEHIQSRRRAHNRFGFALQLSVFRYPGRLLVPGEVTLVAFFSVITHKKAPQFIRLQEKSRGSLFSAMTEKEPTRDFTESSEPARPLRLKDCLSVMLESKANPSVITEKQAPVCTFLKAG